MAILVGAGAPQMVDAVGRIDVEQVHCAMNKMKNEKVGRPSRAVLEMLNAGR